MKAFDVDWSTMRLGRRPDREVAEELGCHLDTVKAARRRLGFAACDAPKPTTAVTDWSKVVFGEEPDEDLAARIGCEVDTVTRRRRDLGIAAFVPEAPPTPYQWKQYARCDECGVDDGKQCRDDNDNVAHHPCAGRKRRRGSVRVDGVCRAGHRMVGENVMMQKGYAYCRECHNQGQRENSARRRNRSLPTEQMRPFGDKRTIDEVLARAIKAETERNALRLECATLLEAVVHAEHIFDSYARHHRASGAIEKMERNEGHAEKMRAALRTAFASAFPEQKAAE